MILYIWSTIVALISDNNVSHGRENWFIEYQIQYCLNMPPVSRKRKYCKGENSDLTRRLPYPIKSPVKTFKGDESPKIAYKHLKLTLENHGLNAAEDVFKKSFYQRKYCTILHHAVKDLSCLLLEAKRHANFCLDSATVQLMPLIKLIRMLAEYLPENYRDGFGKYPVHYFTDNHPAEEASNHHFRGMVHVLTSLDVLQGHDGDFLSKCIAKEKWHLVRREMQGNLVNFADYMDKRETPLEQVLSGDFQGAIPPDVFDAFLHPAMVSRKQERERGGYWQPIHLIAQKAASLPIQYLDKLIQHGGDVNSVDSAGLLPIDIYVTHAAARSQISEDLIYKLTPNSGIPIRTLLRLLHIFHHHKPMQNNLSSVLEAILTQLVLPEQTGVPYGLYININSNPAKKIRCKADHYQYHIGLDKVDYLFNVIRSCGLSYSQVHVNYDIEYDHLRNLHTRTIGSASLGKYRKKLTAKIFRKMCELEESWSSQLLEVKPLVECCVQSIRTAIVGHPTKQKINQLPLPPILQTKLCLGHVKDDIYNHLVKNKMTSE